MERWETTDYENKNTSVVHQNHPRTRRSKEKEKGFVFVQPHYFFSSRLVSLLFVFCYFCYSPFASVVSNHHINNIVIASPHTEHSHSHSHAHGLSLESFTCFPSSCQFFRPVLRPSLVQALGAPFGQSFFPNRLHPQKPQRVRHGS